MSNTDLLNSEPEIISHADLIKKSISWQIPNSKDIFVININDEPTFFAKTERIAHNRIMSIIKRKTKDPDWTYNIEVKDNNYYVWRSYKMFFVSYDHIIMRLNYKKIHEFKF